MKHALLESLKFVICFLLLYVDDIIIFTDDEKDVKLVERTLMRSFRIKCLVDLSYYLGIRITNSDGCVMMDQTNYIDSVLKRFEMESATGRRVPMQSGLGLRKDMKDTIDDMRKIQGVNYRSLVGSVMYAMACTRPDICHAISTLSKLLDCAGYQH